MKTLKIKKENIIKTPSFSSENFDYYTYGCSNRTTAVVVVVWLKIHSFVMVTSILCNNTLVSVCIMFLEWEKCKRIYLVETGGIRTDYIEYKREGMKEQVYILHILQYLKATKREEPFQRNGGVEWKSQNLSFPFKVQKSQQETFCTARPFFCENDVQIIHNLRKQINIRV